MSRAAPGAGVLPGLVVVGLGASIVPLDFAVNVAFPAITDAFAIGTHEIRWVAVCYVLVYGSLTLGFGALGDAIGYLRVFRAGLVLGALAFAACALAPTYGALLAARALQGVSVALALSCAPALATLLVDESRRTWALSAFAGSQAIAAIVAPVIGGLALAAMDWPGVFAFRVPILLAALVGVRRLEPAAARQPPRPPGARPDLAGSVLLAAAVALLLLAPSLLGPGADPWRALPPALAGAAAMAAFVVRQRGAASPLLPARLARDADFVLVNLGACVVQFACFAAPLTVPYFLLRGGGWSPTSTGLLLAWTAAGTLAGSWVAARAVPALGARPAAFAAAAAALAGLAGISTWPDAPPAATMAAWLALQGLGLGVFQVAYQDHVVASLPASSRGVAGSLTVVTRTVGVVVGATVWMGMLQAGESAALAAGAAPRPALVEAFGELMRVAAATIGIYFGATALRRSTWFGADVHRAPAPPSR